MDKYRNNPDAVRALVRDDKIHRDLYINKEIFELEMEHFFRNVWMFLGHDSQIPNPGDYYTANIGGEPVIMSRHTDGTVKVMHNRCPHKGAKVVTDELGNTGKFFRCPYHAWTFKTDGTMLAVPFKQGYEKTDFHQCEAGKGLVPVKHVKVYRGFVFVKMSDHGPGFEEYFGDSLSSIDNMCDRSPVGEVEVAGGTLRYLHNTNWKQFVDNLHDTCHPMVAHESAAGTARELWATQPEDAVKPMAVELVWPFMNGYEWFDGMGIKLYENGHSYTGVNFSIHSAYSDIPEYTEAMEKAYGKERAEAILKEARHNTAYYPTMTIKGAIQAMRVARPIAVDKTIIESWTFRLKGAPDKLLERTCMYTRLINAPTAVVGHDDLYCYRNIQEGLESKTNDWISLHRLHEAGEAEAVAKGPVVLNGTSEGSMRHQYRTWAKFMTMSMENGKQGDK